MTPPRDLVSVLGVNSMPCLASNSYRRTGANIAARERTATMIDILFNGVGWTDIAFTLNRIAVGMFFMFSGYHKLFNPERHRVFADELKELGVHAVGFNQWWVPTVEFSAGCAVIIGLLAPLAALGLLFIIIVAIATSGRQRINAFMLIMVVSAGAGPYSLDAVILGLIGKHGA